MKFDKMQKNKAVYKRSYNLLKKNNINKIFRDTLDNTLDLKFYKS